MRVYGASLETDNGVYLDNFSLRGNPGRKLKVIDTALLRQFNALQDYDLVVLQFGLNVCDKSTTNYDFYEKEMFATVQHLQTILPKASFLLIGVSDRSTHDDAGNLVSFAYIDLLTTAQRKVAERTHIAFWDTRKAMGGNGSMAIWAKNGFANTDYTHLTWGGGKKMGALLYTALKASIAE